MDTTDINDSYDDYSDDFDTGIDVADDVGTSTDSSQKTSDQIDAVADLLMGGDGGGYTAPEKDSGVRTRDLDNHGNPDYGNASDATESQSGKGKVTKYGYDIDSPLSSDVAEYQRQAQEQWDRAHQTSREIEQALRDGNLTPEEAEIAQQRAGMMAGQARYAALEAELAARDVQANYAKSYKAIATEIGMKDPNDFEALNVELKAVTDFLRESGVADSDLTAIDDPAIVITAHKAMKAIENDAAQRGQIIQLKKMNRSLKKKLGIDQGRAQKSNQIGTKHGTENQIDQVAALLKKEGW